MGRQINFFLGPDDQAGFEAALRKAGNVVFLSDRSDEPRASEVLSTVRREDDWLRLIVTQRDSLPRLSYQLVSVQNKWKLDTLSQPIVEFDRCYYAERFIRPGRLYRADRFWNSDNQLTHKPENFVRWADSLYRHAKKFLSKTESVFYVGPQAAQMRADGMLLEGLDFPR